VTSSSFSHLFLNGFDHRLTRTVEGCKGLRASKSICHYQGKKATKSRICKEFHNMRRLQFRKSKRLQLGSYMLNSTITETTPCLVLILWPWSLPEHSLFSSCSAGEPTILSCSGFQSVVLVPTGEAGHDCKGYEYLRVWSKNHVHTSHQLVKQWQQKFVKTIIPRLKSGTETTPLKIGIPNLLSFFCCQCIECHNQVTILQNIIRIFMCRKCVCV
jgi:hypothetical protein